MKDYIISIIGGAVLASLANTVSPDKWTKYVKIITGLMIISIIISPGAKLLDTDIFEDYETAIEIDMNAQKKAVISELEKKISDDIKTRILNEFSENTEVKASLNVNDNYEIEGVNEISIWNAKNTKLIENRMNEVYSPSVISFRD